MSNSFEMSGIVRRVLPRFLASVLLMSGGVAVAQPAPAPTPLGATWLGAARPGEPDRLAVSWHGRAPAQVELWADANGNGVRDAGEARLAQRRMAPGIEVVELPAGTGRQVAITASPTGPGASPTGPGATAAGATVASACAWQPGFHAADLNGDRVHALAIFNGELYAGGNFTSAGSLVVHYIARWNGAGWSALSGPAGEGVDGFVRALEVYNGSLYVGGHFLHAGSLVAQGIARWNGTDWSAAASAGGGIGGGNGSVDALAVWGGALYVGGDFHTAGGATVNHIARWDGTDWWALAPVASPGNVGLNNSVSALAVYDDGSGEALFAGGSFTAATGGSPTLSRMARWSGTAWSALSGPSAEGVNGGVNDLAVYDGRLYAGGAFTTAGGITASHLASWNGTAWSALSTGLGEGANYSVFALTVYGGNLILGGAFGYLGGIEARGIGAWNGSTFSPLSGPSGNGTSGSVGAMAVYNGIGGSRLYAAGWITMSGGVATNHIAEWNGTAWSYLSAPTGQGLGGSVDALAVHDDGSGPALYAGGAFTHAGGLRVNYIARWNGRSWSALTGPSGTGTNSTVSALAVLDDGSGPALYAGGAFTTAGGVSVNRVARWKNNAWSALTGPSGTGTNGTVWALHSWGSSLYVGGSFTQAGGETVNYIARWDGSDWSDLAGGMDEAVLALEVHDDGGGAALYAGGDFTDAGAVAANFVAKWNGTAWSALSAIIPPYGNGMNDEVAALLSFDDGTGAKLYAGGWFTQAGNLPMDAISVWDTTEWLHVGMGLPGGVLALAAYDDGSGPALYAGGWFGNAGAPAFHSIAKWDTTTWLPLTGPLETGALPPPVNALAAYDGGLGSSLYAGGWLGTTGGLPAANIGRWYCAVLPFADDFELGDLRLWSADSP